MTAGRAGWVALTLLFVSTIVAQAQPPIAPPATISPQSLRKIYVPVDGLDPETRGLLPMRRAEYERRIAVLQPSSLPTEAPPGASLTQAIYRATLRGEQLVSGAAELTVEQQKPAPVDGATAWVSLSPCNLAIGSPTWKPATANATAESPTWGQNEKQQLLVAVPRSGVLQVPWSLRGRRDERGRVRFEIELPLAARQQLELRLPTSLRLTSEFAIVRELGAAPSPPKPKPGEAPADSLWQVDVAGGQRFELVVQPRQRADQAAALVLVRETGSYVFTPGQMDLELSLELDIDRAPLQQIRVRHDARLQWTAIRWGEQSLTWTTEKSATGEPVAVVVLPAALTGNSRLIQLTAVADWSPQPQKWTLPRATVENAIWQEGRINIASPTWLQLDASAGSGSRLSATTLASDSQGMDLLQFQLERATATVDVQATSVAMPLEVMSLVSLQVEPKQLVASLAAELTVPSGSHFSIECEIPRAWVVDSIETSPPDLLADRTARMRGGNQQVMTLLLKQPLRANRPLRVNARLRHVRGLGTAPWGDDILQPVRFPAAAWQQRYVTLQLADASFEPRLLSADGLEFLSPAVLPAKVRALTDSPIGSWLVRLTDTARQPRFLLAPGSPRYTASSTLQIGLATQRVDYRLQLACEPESSAVSSVLVQLRPAPHVDPQWRLVSDTRQLTTERLETMTSPGDQPGPAVYRIELPSARNTAFSLAAQWSEPITSARYAPLAEVPEATAHSAEVEIAGPVDTPLTWQAERLRPLPVQPFAEQVRARYRYLAGQDARLQFAPLLETQRPLAGWIGRCDLETEFSPTGAARHEARYLVVGDDVEALELRLAVNARLARAVVDGREVLAFSRSGDPRWLSIPLRNPRGKHLPASPLVRLEYTSPPTQEAGWFSSRWTAPIPETRLPVLQSHWQARLPGRWQLWPGSQGEPIPSGTPSQTAASGDSFFELLFTSTSSTQFSRDLPTGAEVQIEVYSPVWLGLIALVMAFVAAACALRLRSWNAFRLVAAAVVCLALSLVLAEPWRVFGQAALAGWLTGLAWQIFRRPIKPQNDATSMASMTSTSFLLQPVARLILLLGGVWGLIHFGETTELARGQLQAADEAAGKPWRVVIPVDENRQPTDFVYVSPALYEALFRAGPRGRADHSDWLLRSAQYDLRWTTEGAEPTGELQGVVAHFEIEVFRERSILRLPFIREQVRLIDPGVRIEGESAAATWSAGGEELLIELAATGRQRIEVGLALVAPPKDGTVGTQIHIPTCANSRVLIPVFTSAGKVTIPNARGAEQRAENGAWQVDLGAADQLVVQWSRAATEPPPVIEAEQLLLWRMRPSSVVVEGKWQFRPLTGKLREVVLRADPRFRLLPTGNGAAFVRQWTEEGEANLHHFVLDRVTTGDVNLTASFLLVGSTGVGNLIPPRLEPAADRLARDWQAAWTAPGLQWNGKPGTLPAAEFLQPWGDQTLNPVQAFRGTTEAPRPTLTVTAVQNRLQADQQIDWSLTPDQASVRYRLQGMSASSSVNQLRFQLPPQLTVRRVAVTQGEVAVATRWFRHADGLLTLLLDEMRAEPWQVEVHADRPHVAGKLANLPVLHTTEIDVQHYECIIRRRPGAAVTLGKLVGWKNVTEEAVAVEPTTAEPMLNDRVIAHLDWSSPRANTFPSAVPVTLGASVPGFSGELLTRLLATPDGWQVEVTANLKSPGGLFDELQFSIPRDWNGPFQLDPAGRSQVELLPGQSRNLLRVQLNQPVKDQVKLRWITSLAAEQELVRLPAIDLIGSQDELQRWIALPRRGFDSRLQWQTSGLQLRPELPASLVGTNPAAELAYEAIIDRYRASARPERTRREQPRIVLADHHVTWQADRRIVGRTELTILPGGARTLLIQPPEAHELVAAIINDVPGQLRREPGIGGAATIELHSDTWPQWVQIIYRGRLSVQDDPSGQWQFAAPRVAGAAVERTRWQILGPAPLLSPIDLTSVKSTEDDEPLAPLEALVQVAQGVADAPASNVAGSADIWLSLWRQRWDQEIAGISKRPPSSPLAPILAARLQTLKNEMADQLTTPLVDLPPSEAALTPVTEAVITHPLHVLRHTQAGELSTWIVTWPQTARTTSTSLPWLLAASLLVFAAAISQIGRSTSLRDWVIAYPQLVLALFGIAALVVPGYLWLGVFLLACTLLATLHSPWQQRG